MSEKTMRERPMLIFSDKEDGDDVLEVVLGPHSVSLTTIVSTGEGATTHIIVISPADFEALIERGRAHKFSPEDPKP